MSSSRARPFPAFVRIWLILALAAVWQLRPAGLPVSHADSASALSFDGVGTYVEVPDTASLSLPLNTTLEAWINPSEIPDRRNVLGKGPYRLAVEPGSSG